MPDNSNKMEPWQPEPCPGCRRVDHRGVVEERNCMISVIASLRAALEQALKDKPGDDFLSGLDKKGREIMFAAGIHSLADLRAQVRAMSMSAHEKQQAGVKRGE